MPYGIKAYTYTTRNTKYYLTFHKCFHFMESLGPFHSAQDLLLPLYSGITAGGS